MEHLFASTDSIYEMHEYPGHTDYLEIPFLEYPRLHDRGFYLQLENTFNIPDRPVGFSAQDETPFLATWLFCSLLQEFFGNGWNSHKLMLTFHHTDFVRSIWNSSGDRQIMYFHTATLVPLLDSWSTSVSHIVRDGGDYYEHLKRCLNIANIVLLWPKMKLQPQIEEVLASVGDLLSVALDLTFRNEPYYNPSPDMRPPVWWPKSSLLKRFLLKSNKFGHCPFEVTRMPMSDGPFFPTIYFRLSFVRTAPDGIYACCPDFERHPYLQHVGIHAGCLDTECRSYDLAKSYPLQSPCSCGIFRFEASVWEQLLRIVDRNIPLLKCQITAEGAVSEISVVPFRPGLDYVAISHVWSHGLGNPDANELPKCRLEYVIRAVVQCWELKGRKTSEVLLWLDTLCCPVVPPEARSKVIATMRTVYMKAKYVLVLEGELSKLEITSRPHLEIGVRILTSDWMRRLWTLQEGLLATEVWVQFKDTTFPLDSLNELDPYRVPFNQHRIARYVENLLLSIRRFPISGEAPVLRSWKLIQSAIRPRKVTVAADEALCLSTLMDLNTEVVADAPPSDRMQILWREIATSELGVPKGIVFEDGPKITTPGLEWAPRSLLDEGLGARSKKTGTVYSIDAERATLTGHGLLIRSKGLILTRGCLSTAFKANLERQVLVDTRFSSVIEVPQIYGLEYVRDQHGFWYRISGTRQLPMILPFYADGTEDQRTTSNGPKNADDNVKSTTDTPISDSRPTYTVLTATGSDRSLIVRSENRVNETQHVSIVEHVRLGPERGPHFEFSYMVALQLVAWEDFQALDWNGMHTKIQETVTEFASLPGTREACLARGCNEEKFRNDLVATTMTILSGYGYLTGRTVPETQEWLFS